MSSLAVFDLDGTLLRGNASFHFGRFLYIKGYLPLLDASKLAFLYLRHGIWRDDLQKLHHSIFHRSFCGWPRDELSDLAAAFVQERLSSFIYHPAYERLQALQNEGVSTLLLSSSPDFLVEPVAHAFGFDRWESSIYAPDKEGKLAYIAQILNGAEKAHKVAQMREQESLFVQAYSDSIRDLPLLHEADQPWVVNPTAPLKRVAKELSWRQI